MANEQNTEALARRLMNFEVGKNPGFTVYAQTIDKENSLLRQCLAKAGAKPENCSLNVLPLQTKGAGRPEFLVTFDEFPDLVLVIECKASSKNHASLEFSRPKKFAVDGALYYAKYLKDDFDVIAVGLSGTREDAYKSTSFYWKRGAESPTEIAKTRDILLTPYNYVNLLQKRMLTKKFSMEEIKSYANKYNELMRNELKIEPQDRIAFIATCLLALQDKTFKKNYVNYADANALLDDLISAIGRVLVSHGLNAEKIAMLQENARSLRQYGNLIKLAHIQDGSLLYFLKQLELVISPMINDASSHQDALGIFYHEFIKYTAGGAGTELGIVLTPEHLCDFMCELANLQSEDIVLDICCGTASFLVSAMKHLVYKSKNETEIKRIKDKQLYGLEENHKIYAIAITNMIIRGDGQSNIYNLDCFNENIKNDMRNNEAAIPVFTVGLINPPYAQRNVSELEYVKRMLDLLCPRATGVAVVPVSCAIGTKFKEIRKDLFAKHTLKAVFTMPDDIFYPVGTNVCVMVWQAHIPHSDKVPTYFGYCKDDGFVKRKSLGRIDAFGKWNAIKQEWLSLYANRIVIPGKSASHLVSHKMEWLAEAYIETDFTSITDDAFINTVRSYFTFKLANGIIKEDDLNEYYKNANISRRHISHASENMQIFYLSDILSHHDGACYKAKSLVKGNVNMASPFSKNVLPFVSRTELNNCTDGYVENIDLDEFIEDGNAIIIGDTTATVAYQEYPFVCGDHIVVLRHQSFNKYASLYLVTLLQHERFRYSYGRAFLKKAILATALYLPARVNAAGSYEPDWLYMENYIKSLPYGGRI